MKVFRLKILLRNVPLRNPMSSGTPDPEALGLKNTMMMELRRIMRPLQIIIVKMFAKFNF